MSACEKCWRDAHDSEDVAERYRILIEARKDNPCTPEEQAGPDARECDSCGLVSIHQWTGECMNPKCSSLGKNAPRAEQPE